MFAISVAAGVGIVVAAAVGLIGWDSYGSTEEFASAVGVYAFGFIFLAMFYDYLREMVWGFKEARWFRERFSLSRSPLGFWRSWAAFIGGACRAGFSGGDLLGHCSH
jgi:hypothetical protein